MTTCGICRISSRSVSEALGVSGSCIPDNPEDEKPYYLGANGLPFSALPGMCFFHHGDSFAHAEPLWWYLLLLPLGLLGLYLFFLLLVAASVQAGSENYTFTDLQGNPVKLSDYRGKWVIVNYWATWCPPCLDEIPELSDFHEKHAKTNAVVLGVNYENVDDDYLKSFAAEYFISYPIL